MREVFRRRGASDCDATKTSLLGDHRRLDREHLIWAATIKAGNDEANHALFPSHFDWSYFDHPPMLAWVAVLGLSVSGTSFGLRLGFVALSIGSSWLIFRLTRRFQGESAAAWAAFLFNVSGYFALASGTFALPDGPLVFFWLLTLDRLASAFERPERLSRWMLAGLAWGGALVEISRGALAARGFALSGDRPKGEAGRTKTWALVGDGNRLAAVFAGDRLERVPRLGVVCVSRESSARFWNEFAARYLGGGTCRAGSLRVSLDLD